METFWVWLPRAAYIVAIVSFLKGYKMDDIKLFWNILTPWQFLFYASIIAIFIPSIRNTIISIFHKGRVIKSTNGNVHVIRSPDDRHYLVDGNICSHIPDPPTFEYLGSYFGFSWNDAKLMLPEDINSRYTVGKALPSIRLHFPKTQ